MAFGGRGEPHPDEVLKEALKAPPAPVVFLTGGTDKSGVEPWYVETALERLTAHALGDASRDFNLDRLRAEEAGADVVVSRAETLPMMARRRVVSVTDVDRWRSADQERFLAFLKRPVETTTVLLTATKIDRRTGFAKALEGLKQVWRFRKLEQAELVRALTAAAKKSKKTLDPAGAEEMIRRAGEDLRLLLTELDKLVAFVGDAERIGEDDVALATAGAGMSDVFEYADALGRGDLATALDRLQTVLDAGTSAFELIGGLAWHFRTMLRAKTGNAPQFGRMKAIADSARSFPTRALLDAHHEIYRADVTLKSAHGPTGLKDEEVMNRLTRRICALRA
ncbi:MAG TPA: DNA polymerase III subunit delta [bacterium]|nr:DNA polymerase III subunit delta [bacterium]